VAGTVKRRKPYRSTSRARQRESTRAAIIGAAHDLFISDGYAATTITAIAARADVSAESVYVIFGSKRDLLRAVTEAAAAGEREAVVSDDWLVDVRAEPDQRRRLDLMADATRDVMRRVAPLDEVVRAVATSDPEVAELQRRQEAQQMHDVRRLVALLAEAGPLRMAVGPAAEVMWALCRSTGLYRSLTVDRAWSDRRAFATLNDVLARTLLPD
jgi:AcrR family transcriptional regulator